MLTSYLTTTRQLLQNPPAPTSLYSDADLTAWINIARNQVAGESASIRALGGLTIAASTRNYGFSAVSTGVASVSGIAGLLNVRQILYTLGTGFQWVRPRPWDWFLLFKLNTPVPASGAPGVWSQYGQGVNGSIYFDPIPDIGYAATLDCVCYPIALVNDSTVEAIPALWTDAVPYFAAYMALLSSQNAARQADAQRMFERYTLFTQRARQFSTPEVLPHIYAQAPDAMIANRLGLRAPGSGGGAGA